MRGYRTSALDRRFCSPLFRKRRLRQNPHLRAGAPLYACSGVLYHQFVGLIEGIPALLLGIVLIRLADRLGSLQREWSRGHSRWSRYYRTFRLWPEFFDSDRGVLILTYFWRVCGACWVISGITLAAGLATPLLLRR